MRAKFKVGQRVLYRGMWGNLNPVKTTISDIGEKNGKIAYILDNNHWGYEYQLTAIK